MFYIHFNNYYYISSLIIFILFNIIILYFVQISYAENPLGLPSIKANAGDDQFVEEGHIVILKATNSTSSDSPIDSYKWIQAEPNTPLIEIKNSNTANASFLSPNLPNDGNFIFQLFVEDGDLTDIDSINVYIAEDLTFINKANAGSMNVSGINGVGAVRVSYQPEQCSDGVDNDFDGKIDNQDEECMVTYTEKGISQIPQEPQRTYSDPYLQGVLPQQMQRDQMQPNLISSEGIRGQSSSEFGQSRQQTPLP